MRLTQIFMGTMLAAALLAPSAQAASLQYGGPALNKVLPKLNAVGEGRRVWLKYNCYGCHGNNAAGGMGPNIQHAESGDVAEAMNGDAREGGMRSFKGIYKAADPKNISAYLASIGTKNEPTWLDWWNANP